MSVGIRLLTGFAAAVVLSVLAIQHTTFRRLPDAVVGSLWLGVNPIYA